MSNTHDIRLVSFRPNLLVSDLAASMAFYRDLLGFEPQHSDDTFALLRSSAGAEVALVLHPGPQAAGGYLYVAGVEELHQRMVEAGVPIQRALQLQPWGLLDFVVTDPDGHAIGIGEWQTRSGN